MTRDFSVPLRNVRRFMGIAPKLELVAYEAKGPGTTPPFVRDSVNFGIIHSSSQAAASYRVNGKRYEAALPALVFARPGWNCHQTDDVPCEKIYFIYHRSLLRHFEGFGTEPADILRTIHLNPAALEILSEIKRIGGAKMAEGDGDRLDLLCQRLLTGILLDHLTEVQAANPNMKEILAVAAWIEDHLAEETDIKGLWDLTRMPERSFNRKWREHFGVSPLTYWLQRRFERASQLLLASDSKVHEVASRVGFSDPYYFSRLFKKYTGITPEKYRNLRGG